jgi:hypothetical protein
MIYKTQSLIIMIYKNTIPNNKIIPNLNKPKIFVPANYLHILNKNAEKYTKTLAPGQNLAPGITWRMVKTWRMPNLWIVMKSRRPYCLARQNLQLVTSLWSR